MTISAGMICTDYLKCLTCAKFYIRIHQEQSLKHSIQSINTSSYINWTRHSVTWEEGVISRTVQNYQEEGFCNISQTLDCELSGYHLVSGWSLIAN